MAQLVKLHNGEPVRNYKFTRPELVFGRSYDTDIEISESTNVSRRHCRVAFNNNRYVVQDLGSKNGTYLNGKRVESSLLQHGDIIQVGQVQFRFEDLPEPVNNLVFTSKGENNMKENNTVFFRPSQALDQFSSDSKPSFTGNIDGLEKLDKKSPKPDSSQPIGQDAVKLRLLYEISKELITIKPLEEFLQVVVDLVFNVVNAERVFLMMVDEATEELQPKVIRIKDQVGDAHEQIRISRTIAEKVSKEKVAILTTDAQQDERFHGGQSIVVMGIRSAMAVPLLLGEKLLGLIYADTSVSSRVFDTDDLALFSAFANHASIGIEQARLNEKIRKEIALRSSLERYHSPEVINTILETGEDIRPAEREITVLYTDIVGFTTMVESMPPNDLADLLNEYYAIMTEKIFEHGGTLDKFIGDAVMAIFGAPVEHQDDPARAIRAAVAMQKAVFKIAMHRPENQRYMVRVGINTGKAITGDFGSQQRKEFTALGTTVNIAARIEHMVAKPGQIAVGEETFLKTQSLFPFSVLGNFTVKGISKPIKVYQVNYQKRPTTTLV